PRDWSSDVCSSDRLHAAVEVVVGVGTGLALLERRLFTARRAPAPEAADEPREIGTTEQRDHERDDAHDADTAADRDAALGPAADAALADVGALVEGHAMTLVRRRSRCEAQRRSRRRMRLTRSRTVVAGGSL